MSARCLVAAHAVSANHSEPDTMGPTGPMRVEAAGVEVGLQGQPSH